ncbi:MAG: hypothetical protein ACO1RT_00615 [Planctomycetaceae bacterium]
MQRPGWRQIYRFDAIARVQPEPASDEESETPSPPVYEQLYGLVREDARHGEMSVQVFPHSQARCELFAQWSVDMIQLRGGQSLS